jgi:uncharacterized protein (TIGR03437 family)
MQRRFACWMWATIAALAMPSATLGQTLNDFFDGSQLQDLRLTMNPADWPTLKKNYLADTYYKCDFEWRGIAMKNSGLKSRGSGTRNPIKPGLTINFAKYSSSQRFLGLKSIVLRNFAQDASMVHERLTMEMFQKLGLPYEREVHAKLFINNEYIGLFLVVEPLDERFTLTRFGESDGYLYEFNWTGQSFYFNYLGDDPALYVPGLLEAKNHTDDPQPERIRDMIHAANSASDAEFAVAMQNYLDLGSFVTHVAAEEFMTEADGLMNTAGMRNFYLYRRLADNRFVFLVWDKEFTFTVVNFPIFRGTDQNVLMRRALAIPEIRQRYLEALLEAAKIAGGEGGWLQQEGNRVLDQIREAVIADPSRVCGLGKLGLQPCPLDVFEKQARWIPTFAKYRSDFVKEAVAAEGMSMPDPMLMPGQAINAASLVAQLVPGSLARIDTRLSVTETTVADSFPMPRELAGVSVRIGGQSAPLDSVSSTGAVVQVPWELACGPASVVVQDHGRILNTISVEIRPSSPGVFAVAHVNGTLADSAHPARPGEVVVVYATGLGEPAIAQTDGEAPSGDLVAAKNQVSAALGGLPVKVLWAGLTPGFAGLQQVNLRVPDGTPPGMVALHLTVNGETGPAFAMIVQ